MQARKALLFESATPRIKKSGDKDFDVPMSCFDGAEICELVGTYIQSKLTNIMNKEDIGLYRDDRFGIFKNISGPEIERKKKAIVKVFKKCGLSIVVDTNLKTADFLDVTFDPDKNIYKPYRKPNNSPIYINKNSNHPPNILKQNNCRNHLSNFYQKYHPVRKFSINQIRFTAKYSKRVASRMNSNIYQMKYNNLKLTKQTQRKYQLVQSTLT